GGRWAEPHSWEPKQILSKRPCIELDYLGEKGHGFPFLYLYLMAVSLLEQNL
ncbi:16284_t:CDS:2, partial [Dentiscutata erythropus]